MLEVTLYTPEALEVAAEQGEEPKGVEIDVDYVSLINPSTHGPPPLVAPQNIKGDRVTPLCQLGQEVLYINVGSPLPFKIKRISD